MDDMPDQSGHPRTHDVSFPSYRVTCGYPRITRLTSRFSVCCRWLLLVVDGRFVPFLCPGDTSGRSSTSIMQLAGTLRRILLVALARTALFSLTVMPACVVHAGHDVTLDFPSTAPTVHVTHAPSADVHARRSPHP